VITPRICAHTRSGTHYLAKLLYDNYNCEAEDYEKLHFSHTRVPEDGHPIIHLYRPILPVMISIWRVREHLGISSTVRFSDMIRTPWEEMPRSEIGPALLNGERIDRVCAPKDFVGTLPDRWVRILKLFSDYKPKISLPYSAVVERPYYVASLIAQTHQLERLTSPFLYPQAPVGWQTMTPWERPEVTGDDLVYLESFQKEMSWLFG
jgi:hypothetical protein